MQLTRAGEYAIRAIVYLAAQPEGKISLISDIAEVQEVPRSFLAKIIQTLTKVGLVRSHRGVKGGVTLAKRPQDITLLEVIEKVEGPIFLNVCLIRPGECHRDVTCPVHLVWREAQISLTGVLNRYTMDMLVAKSTELQAAYAALQKE